MPSKNQRLKRALYGEANAAVYNDCYPLVIDPATDVSKRKVLMRNFAKALVGVLLLGITASANPAPDAQAAAAPAQQGLRQPDVIYVPTRQTVVDAMLKVASVKAGDLVYDLVAAMAAFR